MQADHTIVAPPGFDPDLDTTLSRIAALESDAGARIYRITDASLAAALDTGMDAEAILGFLRQYSTVEIAANVERTVRDAAGRHGQLRIGSGITWVACDDPLQLALAVAVKAAKLTAISPTAAVSSLPEDKVLAALRVKGVTPTRVDAAREPKTRLVHRSNPTDLGPRSRLLPDLAEVDALAKQLMEAPPPKLELIGQRDRDTYRAKTIARESASRRTDDAVIDLDIVADWHDDINESDDFDIDFDGDFDDDFG